MLSRSFFAMDIYAKLVFSILEGSRKPFLLSKTLVVTVIFIVKDAEEKKMLTGFSNAFHALQPLKAPGFNFSWLELDSHGIFMPKMLIGNFQKTTTNATTPADVIATATTSTTITTAAFLASTPDSTNLAASPAFVSQTTDRKISKKEFMIKISGEEKSVIRKLIIISENVQILTSLKPHRKDSDSVKFYFFL
ncbi:unnamed protein product [Vicia faba]|uniref:CCR4-Not complex component Not1 C-terminal domain-containing protein n=1 Tax=Vicia faba TaxID=3906 RepID=A0AAV0Z8B9_VICFA|nr:unnamed protein product [Vicia faba]